MGLFQFYFKYILSYNKLLLCYIHDTVPKHFNLETTYQQVSGDEDTTGARAELLHN